MLELQTFRFSVGSLITFVSEMRALFLPRLERPGGNGKRVDYRANPSGFSRSEGAGESRRPPPGCNQRSSGTMLQNAGYEGNPAAGRGKNYSKGVLASTSAVNASGKIPGTDVTYVSLSAPAIPLVTAPPAQTLTEWSDEFATLGTPPKSR